MALATPMMVGVYTQTAHPGHALAAGVGCLLGVILSPDLDIDHRTVSETSLGPIVGEFIYLYWLFYAKKIAHRDWKSHMPIVSTAIRILYGFWWLALIDTSLFWQLRWVWVGLAVSDFFHWVMDMLF
jgi:uncharacterized metal-binding protein